MDGVANLTVGGIVALMLVGIAIGAAFCGIVAIIFAALMAKERRPMEKRSMAAGLVDAVARPSALSREARNWRLLAIVSFVVVMGCMAGAAIAPHYMRTIPSDHAPAHEARSSRSSQSPSR